MLTYQLAIEGHGVALGRSAVIRDDLACGNLIEPFSVRLQTSFGYYVVCSTRKAEDRKVSKFISWAKSEFSELLK
jgi:LysR family transcriptional regulator, glycine cleavage system transcriptional activator